MAKYIVEGGVPLRGEFQLAGAKNAALKLMVAALLTPEEVVIQNVPRISDADDLLESLRFLGAKADWIASHTVSITASQITTKALPVELASKNRCTFLIFGALLSRFGRAAIPDPGGCKIGRRPVNRHIEGFRALGVRVERENGFYVARSKKPTGGSYRFVKSSHTGTENLILAATLAEGKTVIKNAATEPEIDNLVELLNGLGARIRRVEPRVIEIEGVEELGGGKAVVMPDRIEAGTAACAAAVSLGDVLLKDARQKDLLAFLKRIEEIGVGYQVLPEGIRVWRDEGAKLRPIQVETRPHPGFMTDWLPPLATLLTSAEGESVVIERIYPNRLSYLRELEKMGAEVKFFNPAVADPGDYYDFNLADDDEEFFHGAKIFGPTKLAGTQLDTSDLRAGAALVVAALSAAGRSEIREIGHIERGYEDLVEKLRGLGARIEKVE